MKLTGIFLVLILFVSCGSDEGRIPNVPVNFRSSLNDPRLSKLNSPGGAVEITGYGVSGLIIYRRADNAYLAYDRCSTVNPEKQCAVTLDDPNLTVTDPCSGAKFSLYDGNPVKAPGKKPLKQYQVSITNFDIAVTN